MSEIHSKMMGGEAKGPTPEQLNSLDVKRVTEQDFEKYEGQIHGLTRDALNPHESAGPLIGRSGESDSENTLLESAKRGELFVGVKNDVVIACIVIKKIGEGSGHKAILNQMRFAAGLSRPELLIANVLKGVKKSLEKAGIHEIEIDIGGENFEIEGFESAPWFEHAFDIKDLDESAAGPDSHV